MPYPFGQPRDADSVRKLRADLERLQIHLSVQRKRTSETIQELIGYVARHQAQDQLIYPDKDNPFRKYMRKGHCQIL